MRTFLYLWTIALLFASHTAQGGYSFKKKVLLLGKEKLMVEFAIGEKQLARGLQGRLTLKDGHGMLFQYPSPQVLYFWMKKTKIPLSIGFFNQEKKLVNIEKMQVDRSSKKDSELKVYKSRGLCLYALEVPLGWFKRKKIALGTRFTIVEKGKRKKKKK